MGSNEPVAETFVRLDVDPAALRSYGPALAGKRTGRRRLSHSNGHHRRGPRHTHDELRRRGPRHTQSELRDMFEPKAAGRGRIARAAAELMAERGAIGTSLDDVSAATGASVSELCRHFRDEHGLVEAVVDYHCTTMLDWHVRTLKAVRSWEDLERWAQVMVAEQGPRGGCPIGTLAAELADTHEELRTKLSDAFRAWSDAIRGALLRLRENGLISADADLDALTTITLAAIQGGLLLTETSRDVHHLRTTLTGAIAELRAHARPAARTGGELARL